MENKLGVIGFGNIARSIITPLLDSGFVEPEDIFCIVKSEKSLNNIKNNYKYKIKIFLADSEEAKIIWNCPVKILAIKPQHLGQINEININKASANKTMVSILAGVSINTLKKKFPNHNCARVVTNVPILISEGLTAIAFDQEIKNYERKFICKVFENSSKIYQLEESYLDIFLAITSSGPAIIALIVEALSDGGLLGGLQKNLSEELVMDMIVGTIMLMKKKKINTNELKNMVSSPGGTTIAALRTLEEKSCRSALIESVIAASNRSKEFS